MASARARVAAFWDQHIAAWFDGADPLPSPLERWFDSYAGVGPGEVTRDGFPEPFQGDLLGLEHTPRMVVLGLNPGEYQPQFQSRDGIFVREIRVAGSYSRWMTSSPYNRAPWTTEIDRNRYYRARLNFTRNWLREPEAGERDLLIFECYPWHSKSVTAPLRPPPQIIEEYVWQPISEIAVQEVFAFGRPWDDLAQALGLSPMDTLGAGGSDYGSKVAKRAMRTYGLPSGQRLVVEWHPGSAGPPSALETQILRSALIGHGISGHGGPPPSQRAGVSAVEPG